MFAFRVEKEECGDDDRDYLDPFMEEGATTSPSSPTSVLEGPGSGSDYSHEPTTGRGRLLSEAKKF